MVGTEAAEFVAVPLRFITQRRITVPTGPGYTACAFPQPAWISPKAVHFSGAFHMERSQPMTFPLCRGVCRVLLRLTAFMVTRSIIYHICGNCTTFFKKFCFYAICSEFPRKAVHKNQALFSEKDPVSVLNASLPCVKGRFPRSALNFLLQPFLSSCGRFLGHSL